MAARPLSEVLADCAKRNVNCTGKVQPGPESVGMGFQRFSNDAALGEAPNIRKSENDAPRRANVFDTLREQIAQELYLIDLDDKNGA